MDTPKPWVERALTILRQSISPLPIEPNDLDWKSGLSPNKERLVEHLSAFANYPDGGFMVFGIDNSTSQVVGVSQEAAETIVGQLTNLGREALEPPIVIDHAAIPWETASLLVDEAMIDPEGDGGYITHFGAIAAARDLKLFDTLQRKRIRVIRYRGLNKVETIDELVGQKGYAIGFEGLLCDQVFGRPCFIADVSWQKRDGPPNDRKIGSIHDHVLVWAKMRSGNSKKTKAEEAFNLMPRTEKADAQYQVFNEPGGPDPRDPFRKIDTTANGKRGRFVESLYYGIRNPFTGEEVWPREGTCWRHSKEEMEKLQADKRLYWGVKGTATTPMRKLFKFEAKQGMSAPLIWIDCGFNQHASAHMETLFGEKAFFETPKPEELLHRIVHIATNPSEENSQTGAVALRMGA